MKKSIAYVFMGAAALLFSFSCQTYAGKYYATALCKYPGFSCKKVRPGDTWQKRFPNPREREIVKRLNRTNMPLHYRGSIAVPKNLSEIDHMDIAPFALHMDTKGKRIIYIDLSHHAFGAYDEDGNLIHWGPVSGGKGWCKDIDKKCETITGDFNIIRKQGDECESGQFPVDSDGGAPMPYCMHFYRGYALHGSTLPGFHASHGCVRLFYDDAKWLNEHFAKVGTKVIVTE